MANPMHPNPKPQRAFDSWIEPSHCTIPLALTCEVSFRRVLDYDGADTGLIEVILPPEICGKGLMRLPRTMFSDEINGRLPEIAKRDE
jgi:hypothetical protein